MKLKYNLENKFYLSKIRNDFSEDPYYCFYDLNTSKFCIQKNIKQDRLEKLKKIYSINVKISE